MQDLFPVGIGLILQTPERSTHSPTLCAAATSYLGLGWSVIPLRGDADSANPKAASIRWERFQHSRASLQEAKEWFETGKINALGIVTGILSRLCVLDFDSLETYQLFLRTVPQLAATYTVQTRRGVHLYFSVPPDFAHLLKSQKVKGKVDLQWEGCYVVAPPSVIDGHLYAVMNQHPPLCLTRQNLTAMNQFLAQLIPISMNTGKAALGEQAAAKRTHAEQLSLDTLIELYKSYAPQLGRNEALFKTALLARDHGYTLQAVLHTLTSVHVHQSTSQAHFRETAVQRSREAENTIRSAFSRPPRPTREWQEPVGLPNNVREALLQQNAVGVIRVIEGLRSCCIQPGHRITRPQAAHLLNDRVGRDTVWAALTRFFQRSTNPSPDPTPNTPNGIADGGAHQHTPQCLVVGATKSGRSPKHRKAVAFIMPSNAEIAHQLGLKRASTSDPLSPDDLKSSKRSRQALLLGLLRRRPGQYSNQWQAERLGISVRTLQRYCRADHDLHVESMFERTSIYWSNLNSIPLPDYLPHGGFFLTDGNGKRYPAKQEIARRLLSRKQTVTLHRQRPNYYWYGQSSIFEFIRFQADWEALMEAKAKKARLRLRKLEFPPYPYAAMAAKGIPATHATPSAAQAVAKNQVQVQKAEKGRVLSPTTGDYRKPLADPAAEALAKRACRLVYGMAKDKEGRLTRRAARGLILKYGMAAVTNGLARMQKRKNVYRPAGFLSTLLRSEAKANFMQSSLERF